jgi:hypothetical protein
MSDGIVFIMGAGASKSAGAPLMKDFFERMTELVWRNRLVDYVADLKALTDARYVLERAKLKSRLDVENLEEMYTALEMVEIIDGIEDLSAGDARNCKQCLDRLIVATLEQTIQFPVSRESIGRVSVLPTPAYGQLAAEAEAIRVRFPTFPISFLTFNYDLAFDYALHHQGARIWYGFSVDRNKRLPKSIDYFKLHGSVHWAYDEHLQELVEGDLDFSAIRNQNPNLVTAGTVCIRVDDTFHRMRDGRKLRYPFIVPPSTNKAALQRMIAPVWKGASMALRRAAVVVIIGYSFPRADQFFRHFFGLSTIGRTRLQKVLIVDPSESAFDELKGVVASELHGRIQYEKTTFEDGIGGLQDLIGYHLRKLDPMAQRVY